ncbi:MAG TPA: 3D domain-containing protein [Mycobacteriales bacterium]
MTRWTPGVLWSAAVAGAVLLGGCQSTGTPTAPPASTGTRAAAPSPAPTTSAAAAATSATVRGTALGVFEVTCHTGPGVTASGRPSSREVVSVDRRLFPFGTRLFIDQVGLRVAADTGPAMVGHRLDIWEPSAAACAKFGRKRLNVWQAP